MTQTERVTDFVGDQVSQQVDPRMLQAFRRPLLRQIFSLGFLPSAL